jgi:tryptophanyl-tRNA synthetase
VGYGEIKKRIHAAYERRFAPLRDKRIALAKDESFIEGVLEEGGRRARAIAREVMDEVRAAAGIATGTFLRKG